MQETRHWILFYMICASLSLMSSGIVAMTIYCNKKLKEHPNMLIAYISICNFISGACLMIYIVGTPDIVCYFGLATLHQKTYALIYPEFTLIQSIKQLVMSNIAMFDCF